MFDGLSKEVLKNQLVKQEAQIEHLVKENEFLQKQVDKLQDALIAKESPIAYEHQRMDQAALEHQEEPISPADRHRREVERKVYQRWFENVERPLFTDADEMISALTGVTGVPEHKSLHGNDES